MEDKDITNVDWDHIYEVWKNGFHVAAPDSYGWASFRWDEKTEIDVSDITGHYPIDFAELLTAALQEQKIGSVCFNTEGHYYYFQVDADGECYLKEDAWNRRLKSKYTLVQIAEQLLEDMLNPVFLNGWLDYEGFYARSKENYITEILPKIEREHIVAAENLQRALIGKRIADETIHFSLSGGGAHHKFKISIDKESRTLSVESEE